MLHCWCQFANISKLRKMSHLKKFAPRTHIFSQPGQYSAHKQEMDSVLRGFSVYYDRHGTQLFLAEAYQGRQALVFQNKVGEQVAHFFLDICCSATNYSSISAATCIGLGIPIWILDSIHKMIKVLGQGLLSLIPWSSWKLCLAFPTLGGSRQTTLDVDPGNLR